VAFGVTCAHEFARNPRVALSEEALYWACKIVDGDWDNGTTFDAAKQGLRASGQPDARVWPYDVTHTQGDPLSPPGAGPDATWKRAELSPVSPDELGVCAALADRRVVVLGVELTPQWYLVDESGALAPLAGGQPVLGLHAVAAVGYDRRGGTLHIRNSWGSGWARSGYASLPFEYFRHITDAWTVPPSGLDPRP